MTLATIVSAQNRARLDISLLERTRLLTPQRIDLVIEVRDADTASQFKVTANGSDITPRFALRSRLSSIAVEPRALRPQYRDSVIHAAGAPAQLHPIYW